MVPRSLSAFLRFAPAAAALTWLAAPTLAAGDDRPFRPDATMGRAQVPDTAKWDLRSLFADDAAFHAALKRAGADRAALGAFRGKLGDPAQLGRCLEQYFRARLGAKKLMLYANLRAVTDQKAPEPKALSERSQIELAAFMAETAFIRREVMAIDDATMKTAFERAPKLVEYRTYLEELRRRRTRVLSDEGERVLGLAGDHLFAEIDLNEIPSGFERIYGAVRADVPLPSITDDQDRPVKLTFSSFPRYRGSADRRVRRDATEAMFASLRTYQDVFAAALAGEIQFHVFLAKSRGYSTALDAYLDRDNIAPEVYRTLISAVRANLAPLHRYVGLRKRALGLPDVHIYDLYAPMVPSAAVTIPYEEGVQKILAALAPLGPEYGTLAATAMDPKNGWVDVFPHQDKESGAFASFAYGVHPYVKLNYLETLDDVSTLAHEVGHAIQQHLSMTKQPYSTSDMALPIVEIPSTFNEKLLSDHLLAHAKTDDERLYILAELVESLRTTIFRQALFAEFELAVATASEKGDPITAEFLNRTYAELIRAYYGKDLVIGENDAIEWASVPHFYYKFYTYAYSIGLAAGVALAEQVQKGGAKPREAYLAFLSAGNSRTPVELLQTAGVDLTKPEYVRAAVRLMDRSMAQMEKLLASKK